MENIEEIRLILERFYSGETALEEERKLRAFFSSAKVPEDLVPDRELFIHLDADAESIRIPGHLDRNILNAIDHAERKAVRIRRINLFTLSGLAAGLLVLVAVYLFFMQNDSPVRMASLEWEDTYQDPAEAYMEVKETLMFVSEKLNAGTSELHRVKEVHRASDPLKSLSKINKGSKELSLLGQLQRVKDIQQ
jgi:hypothetical protein